MHIEIIGDDGVLIPFDAPDSLESRWTCTAILEGRTYPDLPFIGEVATVWDAGANCGAAAVHLARRHPHAVVHAFEPAQEALGFLRRNVSQLDNVMVHPFGLHDADHRSPLYLHPTDLGQASIVAPADPSGYRTEEIVELRSAGGFAAASGTTQIDVLKLDVEGCEVAVLESLGALVEGIKVIYVEYENRRDRRVIDRLLAPSHELYFSACSVLDQGEIVYLRADLADHAEVVPRLREIVFGQVSR